MGWNKQWLNAACSCKHNPEQEMPPLPYLWRNERPSHKPCQQISVMEGREQGAPGCSDGSWWSRSDKHTGFEVSRSWVFCFLFFPTCWLWSKSRELFVPAPFTKWKECSLEDTVIARMKWHSRGHWVGASFEKSHPVFGFPQPLDAVAPLPKTKMADGAELLILHLLSVPTSSVSSAPAHWGSNILKEKKPS